MNFFTNASHTKDLNCLTDFTPFPTFEHYLSHASDYANKDTHPDPWAWRREIENAEKHYKRSGDFSIMKLAAMQLRDIVPKSISTYFRDKIELDKPTSCIFPFLASYVFFRNWIIDNQKSKEVRSAVQTAQESLRVAK